MVRRPLEVLAVMASLEAGGAERQMVLLLEHLDRTRFAPALCLLLPAASSAGRSPPTFR